MLKKFMLLLILAMILAACNGDDKTDGDTTNSEESSQIGPMEWVHSPDTIVLRLDARLKEASPADVDNQIPPCTLWGDGRLVWVNDIEEGHQVLEARLSDEKIRELLEKVIFSGFYDWESDYLIPDSSNPIIESITLNLYSEERTVSRYSDWPVDAYEQILKTCHEMSDTPVLFEPNGGWLTAYEVPQIEGIGYWRWLSEDTGFTLEETISNPRWVTGDLAKSLWTVTVEAPSRTRVLENNKAYELVLRVPGVSRDAPPEPAQ